MRAKFCLFGFGLLALAAQGCGLVDAPENPATDPCLGVAGVCVGLRADADADALQASFVEAVPGQTIAFAAGTFKPTATLAISVDGVTVRGAGRGRTVLDFSGLAAGGGAEGMRVEADDFTIEDLTIRDTRGDGIKVEGADGVVIRRIRVEWSAKGGKPSDGDPCRGVARTENGAYGIYPVQSRRILIEDSEASGASDAGIYVGQSQDIIVRNSLAECNVAGIEIENSYRADVYGNTARHNSGGFLVFDLPGLQQMGGNAVRVFDNDFVDNNTENFAPKGNIVGEVPAGTGVIVMANHHVEIFNNRISGNQSVGVAIASYFVAERPIEDPAYYPWPATVYVHGNTLADNAADPDIDVRIGLAIAGLFDAGAYPDILYDGIITDAVAGATAGNPMRICIRDNGSIKFANLGLRADDIVGSLNRENVSIDAAPYDCTIDPVEAVDLSGLE